VANSTFSWIPVRDDMLLLTKANGILAEMIERRYRSPVDRLDDLI
jgi:hypothetical protein